MYIYFGLLLQQWHQTCQVSRPILRSHELETNFPRFLEKPIAKQKLEL